MRDPGEAGCSGPGSGGDYCSAAGRARAAMCAVDCAAGAQWRVLIRDASVAGAAVSGLQQGGRLN